MSAVLLVPCRTKQTLISLSSFHPPRVCLSFVLPAYYTDGLNCRHSSLSPTHSQTHTFTLHCQGNGHIPGNTMHIPVSKFTQHLTYPSERASAPPTPALFSCSLVVPDSEEGDESSRAPVTAKSPTPQFVFLKETKLALRICF